MSNRGIILASLSLIIAIAGVAVGAFSFISLNNYSNSVNTYVLPMARVYYEGPTYTIASGSSGTFNYNQKNYDTHGAFNLASDSYTIPESGFYHIIAQYSIFASDGDFFYIQLFSNNILICSRSWGSSVTTNTFGVALSDINNFTEGDSLTIHIYIWNPSTASRNIFQGDESTFFAITKLA